MHHFDLYRLAACADLGRLQLGSSFAGAVSLVEWAERLGPAAPRARLDVRFFMLPDVRALLLAQSPKTVGCKRCIGRPTRHPRGPKRRGS